MILYYVHDPMCSWCWGFRPTWTKILNKLPQEIDIKYLLGGLAPDSDEPMADTMQLQIASYWKKIQQHIPETKFNFDFWKNCQPRRSTYPACRAVIAAREQNPELERSMIKAIQTAYYLKAKNPSDDEVLIELALAFNLDTVVFEADLNAKETQQTLEAEIMLAQRMGAQGFPSMILEIEGNYQIVPLDYNNEAGALDFILNKL